MFKKLNPIAIPSLGVLFLGILYFMTFPTSVQSGDTGELVTNSYFLRLLHPPGYPLFTLIYHGFLNLVEFSTVFARASILTILISLTSLLVLLMRFRNLESLLVVMVLGTSLVFWRYSILPDVFALHVLFLCLLLMAFDHPKLLERPWFVILVGACVAHHHTVVFLLPAFLYSALQCDRRKVAFWSVISGGMGFGFYFLLPLFNTNELLSWNLSSVLSHFLREDYGTFQLTTKDEQNYSWILYFLGHALQDFWGVIVTVGFILFRRKLERKHWVLIGSLALYFATFLISGSIPLDITGQEIFERFLIHPFFIMIFLSLLILRNFSLPPLLLGLLGVNVILNIGLHWRENNYRTKTQTEDYTLNVLRSLPENSIYAPFGDAQSFSAYYVHDVLGFRKDVILLPSIGMVSWGERKFAEAYPDSYQKTGETFLEKFNFEKHDVLTNKLFPLIPRELKVGRYGLVYRYSRKEIPENACSIAASYTWRNKLKLTDLKDFDNGYLLNMSNETCFLDQGIDAMRKGNTEGARESFENGLALNPLSIRLHERKCSTQVAEAKAACEKELEAMIEVQNQQYYLHKF